MEVQWRNNLCKRRRKADGPGKRRRRADGPAAEEDWASITGDLVRLIASKIDSIDDYLRFSVVCRSWYSISSNYYELDRKFHLLTPLYMSGMDPDPRLRLQRHPFLNPDHRPKLGVTFTSYTSKRSFDMDLPEVAGRRCWGSPFGWLITLGPVDLQFTLVNPFSRATITLPSLLNLCPALPPNFIFLTHQNRIKAFLTADPNDSTNCFVFVVYKKNTHRERDWVLAFCRPRRDNVWCRVQARTTSNLNDIICFNGKLYGVSASVEMEIVVVSIRIQPSHRAVRCATIELIKGDTSLSRPGWDIDIDLQWGTKMHTSWKYLVEIKGQLHVLLRYILGPGTAYFKLFHIDLPAKKLTRVWTLGDHCLFVGNQSSFAFPATSPPPEVFQQLQHPPDSFRSNYIFYTSNDDTGLYSVDTIPLCPDAGVWDMLHSDNVYRYGSDTLTTYPSLWIVPPISFRRLKESGGMSRCSSVGKCSKR